MSETHLKTDETVLTGLIVPTAWGTDGNVTALVVATLSEEEYIVDEPDDVALLLPYRDRTVCIYARIRGNVPSKRQVITIKRVVEYSPNQ